MYRMLNAERTRTCQFNGLTHLRVMFAMCLFLLQLVAMWMQHFIKYIWLDVPNIIRLLPYWYSDFLLFYPFA